MTRLPYLASLVVIATCVTRAQGPSNTLFYDLAAPTTSARLAIPSTRAVAERTTVGMHLDRLFSDSDPGDRLLLNAGEQRWVGARERVVITHGDFRSWIGNIEGIPYSHVVFTERGGVVSGVIDAVSTTYQIQTVSPGLYSLERIDTAQLPPELEPEATAPVPVQALASPSSTAPGEDTIDVLILYTPAARQAAGGTSQMEVLAAQVISTSNAIFERSGSITRVQFAGTAEFPLIESPSLTTDLEALIASPLAHGLRDAAGADIVHLLEFNPTGTACGLARLLTSLAEIDFAAYSVSDTVCQAVYSATHEMGHNMGSHHAPEDAPTGALFPYSHGFKDAVRGFRTVMALSCADRPCPRIPYFSNPQLSFNGGPTGTASQNNALSIDNARLTVASWRRRQTPGTVPAAPSGLRSTVSDDLVTVSWEPSALATSYTLLVGTAPGTANSFNGSLGNQTASGVVAPGTYYWRVIANNASGSSSPSATAEFTVRLCRVPAAPEAFTFSIVNRLVTLTWTPSSLGGPATTFVIEAGSASGLSDLYNAESGSASPTASGTVPPGAYFVRVRGTNACGIGAPSAERLVIVP